MKPRHMSRFGVLVLLTGLLGAVTATPALAHHDPNKWCENEPNLGNKIDVQDRDGKRWLTVYYVKAVEPTFDIAASTILSNDTPATINRTGSVTETKTYTVTTTHKSTASAKYTFFKIVAAEFGYEFTQQMTDTHTTVRATTEQITLQPHTAWRADRGIEAVWVTYDQDTWELSNHLCWYSPQDSSHGVRDLVPTKAERWDWKYYPTINPGGIVNGVDYTNNIHPGTTVAMFGNGFEAANVVTVRQNGRTWTIGAGTPWWYESYYQVNATLPSDLTPNAYATVSVRARAGLPTSLDTLWPRQVYITP